MLGLEDLNYDLVFDQQEEHEEDYEPQLEEGPKEADDPMETQATVKAPSTSRTHNYCLHGDVSLCHAWMNVPLDALVGTDQSKDWFCGRIVEYYNTTMEVTSSRTKGSLGHRWGTIQYQCR